MSRRTYDIRFDPVTANDLPMLGAWLAKPHMSEWWGDPETELGFIRDMVEGRDTSKPFIFHVDGTPTGYIQYWFIGDHQTEEWSRDNPWLMELPSDAIGVDLSIGLEDRLSSGIGSVVLRAFVENLRSDGWRTIIIDPDPENHRAVRAYTKAGFRPVPHLLGKTSDCLIMRFEPNESDDTQ